MAYLAGSGATLTLAGVTTWVGDITRLRQKQTASSVQLKVLGQTFANTVTGAYHTQYTIDIAVDDGLAQDDLEVGTAGELVLTYATGDTMTCTVVISDSELDVAADGAIIGTLTLDGNSALVHAIT